jgi:hypothetical protein
MAYMRQRGVSAYSRKDYSWEFRPPLTSGRSCALPVPIVYQASVDAGGCGCGGACADCSSHGLGLFDSGLDLTQWGISEWAVAGTGLYLLFSLFGDVGRVSRRVRKGSQKRRARSERRAELMRELRQA